MRGRRVRTLCVIGFAAAASACSGGQAEVSAREERPRATSVASAESSGPLESVKVEVVDSTVLYRGGDSRNDVVLTTFTVTESDDGFHHVRLRLRDAAAEIEAGEGCARVDAHEVRCDFQPLGLSASVEVRLGAGDDVFSAAGACAEESLGVCLLDVFGGGGDDTLVGSESTDRLFGGPGDDVLEGRDGEDDYFGDVFGDYLYGGSGADDIRGGKGGDALVGDGDGDRLSGGPGRDAAVYRGRSEPVRVTLDGYANDGAQGEGDAVAHDVEDIEGGRRGDVLIGNDRANHLDGGAGHDVILGRGGRDLMSGGAGADTLRGGAGSDRIVGGSAAERGASERRPALDRVVGGAGRDYVITLDGGVDIVRGGSGRDRAVADRADDLRGIERRSHDPYCPLEVGCP